MIIENAPLPLTSKSKVKGFSLGFNALDAEMSQMGHYDDDFHQNYYPNVEYVDNYDTSNNQGKRKLPSIPHGNQIQSAQEMIDANKLKKRFVWPESLHRDFVSAVFDIGLKNSTSKLLLQMLPQTKKINTENLKSHLQKFRIHRDRSRGEYASYYEMSTRQLEGKTDGEEANESASGGDGEGPSSVSPRVKSLPPGLSIDVGDSLRLPGPSAMAVIAENNRLAALEKCYVQENSLKLKIQIDCIANYISEQSAFLFSLKNSISKQTKLHGQLMHKLSQLDPSMTTTGNNSDLNRPLHPSSSAGSMEGLHIPQEQVGTEPPSSSNKSSQRSDGSGGGGGAPVCTARAELQIMSEMRSHMDMHRQLLMRKEDQISRHKRGEELSHYASGMQNGLSHSSSGGGGDPTHDDQQGGGHYTYPHPALDCNLILMGGSASNPTTLVEGEAGHSVSSSADAQESTYTDSKSTYAVNDSLLHHSALSHHRQESGFSRDHEYLYHPRPDLDHPANTIDIKTESGEMKFQGLGAQNNHMINYSINLTDPRALHMDGGLEGFCGHSHDVAGHSHAHSSSHAHALSHTLQTDMTGVLPPTLPHRHHHQTNEGKVMAHSEGLNAADWNWDDSLDHNLFSFLLDNNRTTSE